MCGADLARYGKILEELQNDLMKVNDNYPKDMTEAIFMLMNYKQTNIKQTRHIYNDYEGLELTQYGRITPDDTKKKCYNCTVVSYISRECPKPRYKRDDSKAKGKTQK